MGFLTVMCVNSEQVGYFFAKDFFSFFQSRHFQERQTEDSERGGSRRELQNSANKHYRPKASL